METGQNPAVEPPPERGVGPFTYELGAWIPVAVLLALLTVTLGQILAFNGGVLTYNMDDPYIGYALAEEIARGNYGINPGELSSPASTLLWPFLLAPVIGFGWGVWVPLLLNVVSVSLAVYLVYVTLARSLRPVGPTVWRPLATTGAVVAVLLLNLVFVTFAGMEHGPQVVLGVLVAVGLVEWMRSGTEHPPSGWLVAALCIGPLIRFEALALTAPALVLLWLRGRRGQAAAIAVATALPIVAFVGFLAASGIGPLPSSIAVRSPELTGGGVLDGIVANAWRAQLSRPGLLMLFLLVPVLGIPFDRERSWEERSMATWLLAAVALHFAFGQFGYWGRYEAYLWGVVLVVGGYLARGSIAAWATRVGVAPALTVIAAGTVLLTWPYVRDALKAPLASNDVFIEQRQLNRLATDFLRGPLAVNDVGYVAFRNDHYVLDLFGLTSHDIRERRATAGVDPSWMDEVAREHDVDLVAVYVGARWFSRFPTHWVPLGRLQIERFKALVPERQVTLFATRAEAAPELRRTLSAWGASMPDGSRVDLVGPAELGLTLSGAGVAAGEGDEAPTDSTRDGGRRP